MFVVNVGATGDKLSCSTHGVSGDAVEEEGLGKGCRWGAGKKGVM